MADTRTMVSWSGTVHKVGAERTSTSWAMKRYGRQFSAACSGSITMRDSYTKTVVAKAECKRCFPAASTPSDSLGAASTTLNPPPGEHTGDADE